MATSTDLNELYFEYKVLTKIEGDPDFSKFHQPIRYLTANACSVPCTLGGGANGYIGMLVSNTAYTSLAPGTLFIAPLYPGVLYIPTAVTQYQIAHFKSQHEE